jgi:hypothetical protein
MDNGDPITKLTILEGREQRPSLAQAQEFVAGSVEMITMLNGDQVLLNTDAEVYELPFNIGASAMLGLHIRGDVVVLRGEARWHRET